MNDTDATGEEDPVFTAPSEPRRSPKKVSLSDLGKVRRVMAREYSAFKADAEADVTRFRAAIYALKAVADVIVAERNVETLEKELAEIREIISQGRTQ